MTVRVSTSPNGENMALQEASSDKTLLIRTYGVRSLVDAIFDGKRGYINRDDVNSHPDSVVDFYSIQKRGKTEIVPVHARELRRSIELMT